MPTTQQRIAAALADPTTSYWLRQALTAALERDVCDAAADADFLAELLRDRAVEILKG